MSKNLIYFIKYSLFNGGILILNFLLYLMFLNVLGNNYILAHILSYAIVILISYAGNKIIFENKNNNMLTLLIQFIAMKVFMGIVSTLFLKVVVNYLCFSYEFAWIFVSSLIFVSSFLFSKLIFGNR